MPHSRSEIDALLIRSFFANLSYIHSHAIVTDLMVFNHRPDGLFYLSSRKDASVYPGVESAVDASLVIYKEEDVIDDIGIVRADGELSRIADLESSEAIEAVRILSEKSPLARLVLENEFKGQHTLFRFAPKVLTYNTHGDIRRGRGPTVLQLEDA